MADKGKGMMSPPGSVNVESSSSSVNTTTLDKDNPQQPLWRYVKKLGKGPGGGGNKMFNCNFCEVNYTGSYTRVEAHLLHIACVGIRPCPKLTKEEIDVLKKEQDAAETKKSSSKSKEVLGGIDDDLTALELWSTLATTYSQVSEARFLQLRRQFQDIKRGTRTVLEYLNEIKSVSDQLAAIGHPVSDKDKVQQALSGLETEFDIFCTALEVLPVLPSFEDLKAKLFQHEASRVQRHNLVSSNSHNVLITGTLQGNCTRS
ncbi:hypothetical protein EJ110_NYTH33711 [Nymphaea thermarum]|nr:hypothetical protein EJ110_NYTH33711 [Nymphaea thermarum]